MRMPSRSRTRATAATALLAAAMLAIAGCSSPDEDSSTASSATAEAGALPVTIEQTYGSTTVQSAPSRVAAMGVGDGDTLLALGIQPVAIATFGEPAVVKNPWNANLITGDPVNLPKASQAFGDEIAKTLGTQPDLITAVGADPTQEQYNQLSKAVPTVMRPADYPAWQVPWDVQTEQIGKAVGQPEAVKTKIEETKKTVADLVAAHPELNGKTAVALTASPDGTVSIFGPGDGRQQILESYGLTFPEGLKSAVTSGFYGTISAENVGMLDQADIIVALDWQGANDQLKANPAWNAQSFVTQGRTVYINQEVGTAMGVPSVLSIPWIAEQSVPQIAEAAAK